MDLTVNFGGKSRNAKSSFPSTNTIVQCTRRVLSEGPVNVSVYAFLASSIFRGAVFS
jgi:hypothetical protein